MTEGPWGRTPLDVSVPQQSNETGSLDEISRCATLIRKEMRAMYQRDFPGAPPINLFEEDENVDPKQGAILFMAVYEKEGSPASLNNAEQIMRSAAALHEEALAKQGYGIRFERIQARQEGDTKIPNGIFMTFEKTKS